jgi:hypothetical protein
MDALRLVFKALFFCGEYLFVDVSNSVTIADPDPGCGDPPGWVKNQDPDPGLYFRELGNNS